MKNKKLLITILLFFFISISFANAAELGDVNEDNSIDIVDALLVAQYYVGLNPGNFNQAYADVNCSGDIDIVDALLIAQYYVGLISSFPCSTTQPPTPSPTPQSGSWSFITRSGSRLYEDGREYRFVSVNIPNYWILEDPAGNITAGWHRVTEFEQRDACRAVKRLGGQVFRTYVFSVKGGTHPTGDMAHIIGGNGNINYNEELWQDVDRGLQIAREEGVRMYIPLVDEWQWHGGDEHWAKLVNSSYGAGDFWSNSTVRQKFKDFITWLVNRTNTVNGIQYKNDPTIMAWELGNEIESALNYNGWITEMADHIKSQDPNHLIIDGGHKQIPSESLNCASIDIVTTHYTNGSINSFTQTAHNNGKQYIYGEYDPTSSLSQIMNDTLNSGAAGCLAWSLRFRTEYGGFYYHSDFGDSLQYPGFPDSERQIFNTLRDYAYEIQGISTPPTEPVPPAPVLLSIPRPSEISWQGSAGCTHYILQRSTSATGNWTTIDSNVPAAQKSGSVAKIPIYSDNPGSGTWYYRVIAVNGTGESEPSNVMSVSN